MYSQFAASALESNPSVQDLTVLHQTLLTLQQQQLLQLQLIQQLQNQLHPQSEGSDDDNEEEPDDDERAMVEGRSASSTTGGHRPRKQRRSGPGAEPSLEMDDRGEDGSGEEQDRLSAQSQKSKQEQAAANNGSVKCSNSNGDGLSPHFATLLNCHDTQDPNQPLSPGLQSSFESDGLGPGNGMNGQAGGMGSGLGSLNSLEMLQKRAEEV